MRHDIESCDQGGEDQDEAWLDGPVAIVKGKSKALKRGERIKMPKRGGELGFSKN
jgi:hypothetical protein